MKKLFAIAGFALVLNSCNDKKKTSTVDTDKSVIEKVDSTLITDSSWGPITANTNFESLIKIYGDANVKNETICGPECVDSIDVTIVYPNTNREITVYWDDSAYHKKIGMIETAVQGSPYKTAAGLKVGSTLRDLLKVNGKRITFSGFGWDYGGTVLSYGDGLLGKSSNHFTLDYKDHPGQSNLYGDRELHTDMPDVQNNLDKIVIYTINQSFR